MENQNKIPEVQNIVEEIILSNDASEIGALTLNANHATKQNILSSIKKLDMAPLSTANVCS